MAPMPSTDQTAGIYDQDQRTLLLQVAAQSIAHGLHSGRARVPNVQDYPEPLRARRASFVTLELRGQLRGCIGVLEAIRPLVADVAQNAFAAAFEDPRFPPLGADEYPELSLKISILTPPESLRFSSEAELLAQLRPGVDGLILSEGRHRGTFLPSVWEQLPNPRDFWEHLKWKAGLPFGYWSDSLQVARYETESFGALISNLRRT